MKNYYDAFLGIFSDGELLSLSSAKFASPLGLNVIGTRVKQKFPEVFVRIYNLEISNFEVVRKDIADATGNCSRVLAGLTLIAGNVLKSLQLAELLKSLGCDVIIGGPEISDSTARHFSSLPMVDAVCVGFGERIISDVVKDGIRQKIYTTASSFDFQNSAVDYGLLFELEKHGGVSMLWGGDCHLFNRRCYFCSRQERGFGWRDPSLAWEELRYPYSLGINKFYNTADTVAVNLERLRRLAESKPPELAATKVKCFINATQVTRETAKLLRQLNAWAAVGIESFSRVSAVGKGKTTLNDNYHAIEVLADSAVPMILTFVMGLPGEDEKSLKADEEEILRIVREYERNIHWITVSPLLITLGSRAFTDCTMDMEHLPKRHQWEVYSPVLLTEKYFEKICLVELDRVYNTIAELKKEIGRIAPEIIFDSKGLDPKRWLAVQR